jgi:PPOX class probable F420-dependent enzyme
MDPAPTQTISSPFSAPEPDAPEAASANGDGPEAGRPQGTTAARLPGHIRAYLDQRLFAALSTVDPDGSPRQAVIWYRMEDDERVLVNSRIGRRWPANLQRDGRIAIAVVDPADGNRWVGLTGHVDEIDDDVERARDDIVALAHRYQPDGPAPASIAGFRSQARITFRIAVDGVHDHLED